MGKNTKNIPTTMNFCVNVANLFQLIIQIVLYCRKAKRVPAHPLFQGHGGRSFPATPNVTFFLSELSNVTST